LTPPAPDGKIRSSSDGGDLVTVPLLESPFWEWGALVLGLIVGSFANVCIHRLPRHESVGYPPSRCPRCAARIRPWDNVPVLSYLVLRGRCRGCRAPISARYPIVEAANGAAYYGLACLMGPAPRTLVMMALVTALLVLSLIDLEWQILPNAITLPGIAVGLAASFLPGPPSPLGALASAAGGYLALMLVALTWKWLRKVEALGQGDWKMAAMLGAFLGWQAMLLTVFLASLLGTVVGLGLMAFAGRSGQHRLPLGTFLGFAGIGVVFAGEPVLRWYQGLLGG
jgi:leader peptidase (prepilin peptidase)/N-methyltransferase